MNFEKEAEIDAQLAALSDDELRSAAKAAIALAATVLHHQQQVNAFLHALSAQFNQAGEKFGRDHEVRVVGQINALEAILRPTKTKASTLQ